MSGFLFWFDVELNTAQNWTETARSQAEGCIVGFQGSAKTILTVNDRWKN